LLKIANPAHRNFGVAGTPYLQEAVVHLAEIAGVDDAVLPSIERVALGADLDLEGLLGCPHVIYRAACAGNRGLMVLGMDFLLHLLHTSLIRSLALARARVGALM